MTSGKNLVFTEADPSRRLLWALVHFIFIQYILFHSCPNIWLKNKCLYVILENNSIFKKKKTKKWNSFLKRKRKKKCIKVGGVGHEKSTSIFNSHSYLQKFNFLKKSWKATVSNWWAFWFNLLIGKDNDSLEVWIWNPLHRKQWIASIHRCFIYISFSHRLLIIEFSWFTI